MTGLIDISPPITPRLAVWPGDVPYRREVALDLRRGDPMTLSSVTTTLHLGAHADAPSHHGRDAPGMAARSLDLYFGPCRVIHVDVPPRARVRPEDLPATAAIDAPRVLIGTGSYPDPERFDAHFAGLSAALIDHLHAAGVRLVGIDTPSVDPFEDTLFESHQALLRHDMANLEGLVLSHVPAGRYTLIALPLPLVGADASPVRAALAPEP